MVTYSESGVDIDLEEVTVAAMVSELKSTLKLQDVITETGHFAALLKLGDKALAMSTDGVGSKILVAELMDKYDTVGIDCVAMVVNDILCVGAEPLAMVDYLAVEKPDPEIAAQLGKGLAEGATQANTAMIGGETASLPRIVHNLDLAGTGIGLVDVNRIITGESIKEGHVVIGIESSGIHSNGLSLARKVFFEEAGLKVEDPLPTDPDTTVGEALLEPTRIYVKPIVELLKEVKVHGLAHITGGGFNNLKRLKKGLSYHLDNLPEPPSIFQSMYSQGVPLEEMYRVFNMGVGFAVMVALQDAPKALQIINKYHPAQKIGKVLEDGQGQIKLKTMERTWIKL
ncbi:MAG TPA: phosphoribosylformylglycinamidine cyclo-ligase [Methanobacteriaceae archaeon]|nr:phosphoribosylformylglycinamidine cyclo-ligase [Methanobacteriaceae archaeon]